MPHAAGPLDGHRVLIVEDEYLIADEMRQWLRQAGADIVGPVPDVEQALDLIDGSGSAVDAAVLDVNLGQGETAYPIADRLKEVGVPYLFATGDLQLLDDYRSRPRLDKPISERELLRALDHLLKTRSPGRA